MSNVLISITTALFAAAIFFASTPLEAQTRLDRIARENFDVIPPSERVVGEPGEMRVTQDACRVGPTNWARRRIVDIATQEWAYFGFQTIDTTKVDTRFLPEGIVPDTINPEIAAPRVARQYLRIGEFDGENELAATIGGYWSAAPNGPGAIAAQNRAWSAPGGDSVRWRRPWSAAFISWVMCEAGLGDIVQFERSVAHRVYIDQAIRARDGDAQGAAFVAYEVGQIDFKALLADQVNLLNAKLAHLNLVKQFHQTQAALDELTGKEYGE